MKENIPAIPAADLPVFDYSTLPEQVARDLELAENEYHVGCRIAERGLCIMANAVAIAHDVLCGPVVAKCDNGKFAPKETTFRAWCASLGIKKDSAYRLLNIANLLEQSTPKEQELLETLSPSLLYAAAKPSAPAEAVAAVKNGDITTLKQYKELEEKCKAAEASAKDAEKRAEEAERGNKAAQMVIQKQKSDNEKLREENAALRQRTIEVTATVQPDPAEIERLAQEKAEEIAAPLREQARKSRDYEWETPRRPSRARGRRPLPSGSVWTPTRAKCCTAICRNPSRAYRRRLLRRPHKERSITYGKI